MGSFHLDYMKARDNVMTALNLNTLEARLWLVKHAYVIVKGKGVEFRVTMPGPHVEVIEKLAGPHGVTLVKVMDIKAKNLL